MTDLELKDVMEDFKNSNDYNSLNVGALLVIIRVLHDLTKEIKRGNDDRGKERTTPIKPV